MVDFMWVPNIVKGAICNQMPSHWIVLFSFCALFDFASVQALLDHTFLHHRLCGAGLAGSLCT